MICIVSDCPKKCSQVSLHQLSVDPEYAGTAILLASKKLDSIVGTQDSDLDLSLLDSDLLNAAQQMASSLDQMQRLCDRAEVSVDEVQSPRPGARDHKLQMMLQHITQNVMEVCSCRLAIMYPSCRTDYLF